MIPFAAQSLAVLCALLFADGATISATSTVLVLAYGRYLPAWQIATAGAAAAAAGSAAQLGLLRWALHARQPWMHRFAPSRERVRKALERYPSASFMMLVIARATPLPDAPLKLAAAVAGYPIRLYALASFAGTVPYFFVLALIGGEFRLPLWVLAAAFALVVLAVAFDHLRRRWRGGADGAGGAEPPRTA